MLSKLSLFVIIAAACLSIQTEAMDRWQSRDRKARSKKQAPIDYVRLSVMHEKKNAEKAKAKEIAVPKENFWFHVLVVWSQDDGTI